MKCIKTTLIMIVIITLTTITGCSQKHFTADKFSLTNPWTNLNFNSSDDNFHFVIAADRTGKHRPGIFAGAIEKINHLQPEFVICVGDLVDGDKDNHKQADQLIGEWDEFDAMVEKLEMPFFYITGNHDLTSQKAIDIYKQRRDRSYYHFLYKGVLFLCLNSEDTGTKSGGVSDEQIDYFAEVLQKYGSTAWTCVFIHKPIWNKDATGWEKFSSLLDGRDHTVFAGHRHTYNKSVRDGINYYNLATTGAKSNLTGGPLHGRFDHIMSVTMTENGPRIANLMLDGIYGDNPPEEAKQKLTEKIAK